MQSIKEQSLIDSAERITRKKKTPMDLYELFDIVCAEKDYPEKTKKALITQFYTDLITSAKFVYTGDNTWDLKEYQKTDLREKDGSYYKEYTIVKEVEETKKATKVKVKKKAKAKVEPVVEEIKVKEVIPTVTETEVKETVKETVKVEEVTTVETPKSVEEDQVKEYEEEVFEEFEDEFDEEKYNEYMDTYEDKYDEK